MANLRGTLEIAYKNKTVSFKTRQMITLYGINLYYIYFLIIV